MSALPLCACGCLQPVTKHSNQFISGHKTRHYRGTPEQRFWKYVQFTETCWLWTGAKQTPHGYGVIRIDGKTYRVHRLAWSWFVGPIPDGIEVCHDCPN